MANPFLKAKFRIANNALQKVSELEFELDKPEEELELWYRTNGKCLGGTRDEGDPPPDGDPDPEGECPDDEYCKARTGRNPQTGSA